MLKLKGYTGDAEQIEVFGSSGSVAIYDTTGNDVTAKLEASGVLIFSSFPSGGYFEELFGTDWAEVAKYCLGVGGLTEADLRVFQ